MLHGSCFTTDAVKYGEIEAFDHQRSRSLCLSVCPVNMLNVMLK
jgi:hypothetical protein